MKHHYNVLSLPGRCYLSALDMLCVPLIGRLRNDAAPPTVKNILICNGVHIGDVVLTTTCCQWIKNRFPDCKIGFLAGSWSREVAEAHPLVDRVHVVDHWFLNRSDTAMTQRVSHYVKQIMGVLREINAASYDCAVDCYPYYPNSSVLL